jgi:DNA-binding protein HU-beta
MQYKRPEDLFRAEKERALGERNSQHARLLAEAKAAFDKLMAEGQAARKSGRPRKHPLPPLKTTPSTRAPIKPAPAAHGLEPTLRLPTMMPAKPAAPAKKEVVKKASKPAKHAPAKKTKPKSAKKRR